MHHMEERQDLQSIFLPTGFRGMLSAGDVGKLCTLVVSFPSKIQHELKHPVFKDNSKICAHLIIYAQINVRDYCRRISAEEQVMHGDHKGERSQEVTDEMTSQPSVKYGEKKVEMRCGQWYLHKNIIRHVASFCYNLNTVLMSCSPPAATHQGQASSETSLLCPPCKTMRVLPAPSIVQLLGT